ncbi:MAG: PIN domain-containing protein [Thermaceae bacterium]|nr:PIN domain-containing protein [Thermaceae bacterium]
MHLLDTNAWIGFLKGHPALVGRIAQTPDLAISTITLGELYYGARKSGRVEANLARVSELVGEVSVAGVSTGVAETYGVIRADLEALGTPIGPNDLWIAAIAKAGDHTLVTHNTREFARVVGLRWEDWEAES